MDQFSTLSLIAAHRWRRATLTTYALSASFTEAVVIEALLRQGVSEIVLLADTAGIRMALHEHGAVRIGREYAIHAVSVEGGCFHPKLIVLEADDATHVLVGSGNLTCGGWVTNVECVDHLQASEMAEAVAAVGEFFEALATDPRCRHDSVELCGALAARLRAAAAAGADRGRVRLLHSLGVPIADAVVDEALALGGATRLTVASPYWDSAALDRLVARLGLAEYYAHVPAAALPAPKGMDWPRLSAAVRPVIVKQLNSRGPARPLHAKVFEIVCREGRLVLSGSANATGAGLDSGAGRPGNVEVSTLRIERGSPTTWILTPTSAPPPPSAAQEPDEEDDLAGGVLVASYSPAGIEGHVLTRWRERQAVATLSVGRVVLTFGSVPVDSSGSFVIPIEAIADEIALEGRAQLRLTGGGDEAEGFVTAPDFKGLRARAGSALPSMLAVLKQMHTPEDVLAVLEFFRFNPDVLGMRGQFGSRRVANPAAECPDPLVDPDRAGRAPEPELGQVSASGNAGDGRTDIAWQKLVERLLASMPKARPAVADAEDEKDRTEARRRRRLAQASEKLGMRFPGIFYELTAQVADGASFFNLLRLTHLVCVTTSHASTAAFLDRLLTIGQGFALSTDARGAAAWCIVYLAGADCSPMAMAAARSRLIALGIDPNTQPAAEHALPGLAEVIAPGADIAATIKAIRHVRTVHEEVQILEADLRARRDLAALRILPSSEHWPGLQRQFKRDIARRRIHFVDGPVTACPKCQMQLLPHEKVELARRGLCEASCHGYILARNG